MHVACANLNDPIIRLLKDNGRVELSAQNFDQKTPKDILSHKAKQAGQLTRFVELIDQMDTLMRHQAENQPQE